MEIRSDAQQLREFIQDNRVVNHQKEFIRKFKQSLSQIDKIGQTFTHVMEKTKDSLTQNYQAIQKLQNQAINAESGLLLNKLSNQIDGQITEFLKDLNIKQL